jgi:hypothetical protein
VVFVVFCLELFWQCGIFGFSVIFWNCSNSVVFVVFLLDFGIVLTTNTTLSEQFQNLTEKQQIPHCRNSSKI